MPDPDAIEDRVTKLVLEYAQAGPLARPLRPELSLRRDLAIESLSLVSMAVQLGEDFDVDLEALGLDLSRLDTVGDLVALGHEISLARGGPKAPSLSIDP